MLRMEAEMAEEVVPASPHRSQKRAVALLIPTQNTVHQKCAFETYSPKSS
jgi:hypothetical protein